MTPQTGSMQNFRRLQVWRKAHALRITVYGASRSFARRGSGVLRSQLTRSAESMPTNIVEGCFAATQKEFARFLDISIKSSGETEYHLQAAHDYGLLPTSEWRRLTSETVEARRMLIVLRKKVLGLE